MNPLSWLLYLVDVVGTLDALFATLKRLRDDGASIAKSPQVLGRIEAEAASITKGARHLVAQLCTMRLRAIFDQAQTMFTRKRTDGIHATGLAKHVGHTNRTSIGRHGTRQLPGVHIKSSQLWLNQNRFVPGADDGDDGRNIGVGGNQYVTALG